jgi:hypothetical protein
MNQGLRWVLASAARVGVLVVVGCGDGPAASDPSGGGAAGGAGPASGGSAGAGGASGEKCPAGSHAGPSGGCEATLTGWTEAPPLAQARDHQLSFVASSGSQDMLFAAGGVEDNADLLEDIEVAAIQPDGSLAPWAAGGKLPGVMAGAGVAVVGATVVVTGGFRLTGAGSPTLSSATDVGRVMPDGTIGSWTVGPKLDATRFHHAMVANGPTLYVLGGLTGDNTDNIADIERADVLEDGTVGAWVEVPPLPGKRSHHSAAIHDDAIYVTGGLEGDPAGSYATLANVLRAPIQQDGTLGEWAEVGQLPMSLTTHASFVHAAALYVVGGIEDDFENTAAVRRASLGADGTLGAWEELPSLPTARAHAHQTPLHNGFVYAVAGAVNHASIANVFVGRFE